MKQKALLLCIALLFSACNQERLPILANPFDSNDPTPVIPPFAFMDQDSTIVTDKTFDGKVYVADFIFLACPGICPKMNHAIHEVYQAFALDDRVLFLSHTIDPEHDSIPALKAYAKNLGINSKKWHFVHGNADSIYQLANKHYFTKVYPDSTNNRNFFHGSGLLLIDKQKHIRGVYDGTQEVDTKKLIKNIKLLLEEN